MPLSKSRPQPADITKGDVEWKWGDDESIHSNSDSEMPTLTIQSTGSVDDIEKAMIKPTRHAQSGEYDAAAIRAEFKTYQASLPSPDKLLQQEHSFIQLREKMAGAKVDAPRFLLYKDEGGIKPHLALCCLLLSEFEAGKELKEQDVLFTTLVRILSFGYLHNQLNHPADFIRDQFYRVAHAVPTIPVSPEVLRKTIRNRGLPVPNYFLDPEDEKQFPPHIALLVILQDGEKESRKFNSNSLSSLLFSAFAFVALLLRIILEVIGGAGAIWGGAEVAKLRTPDNAELWRWISIGAGIVCWLRFVTLNAPQREDEGGILGPAGPWSLRLPARLRAVCDHPFHYFMRALPPCAPKRRKKN